MGKQEHKTIGITGMTCSACSSRVERVLNKMEGVDAQVNLMTEVATVDFDPDEASLESIIDRVNRLGFGVQTEELQLRVSGMTCTTCSSTVERNLNETDGIVKATVNFATETVSVTYYANVISEQDIVKTIERLGYGAEGLGERDETTEDTEEKKMRKRLIISVILSSPLLLTMLDHLLGITLPAIFMNPWFQMALATPVQFYIGWVFYDGAFRSLRAKSANMDVLVALGTSAAYFYSVYEGIKTIGNVAYEPHLYFETSAVLITLILFGKYLETRAKGQTSAAISSLLELQAREARILRDGREVMIPIEEVVVGDRLVVKPGEKVPVDGIIGTRK